MLERTHPQYGKALRLIWAKLLAQGGHFEEAVDLVWEIEEARPLAETWIERAIEFGDINGARMLAHRVAMDPAKFMDTGKRLQALMRQRR